MISRDEPRKFGSNLEAVGGVSGRKRAQLRVEHERDSVNKIRFLCGVGGDRRTLEKGSVAPS